MNPTNCTIHPKEKVKNRDKHRQESRALSRRMAYVAGTAKCRVTRLRGTAREEQIKVILDYGKARIDYARAALISGQGLNEQMCSIAIRDRGMEPIHPREARQMFSKWLCRHAPKIPRDKAYQWMSTAAHVMRLLLEMRGSGQTEIPIWIRDGTQDRFISDVLEMPEAECSEEVRMFKDTFNTFLSDSDSVGDAADWLEGIDSRQSYAKSHPKSKAAQPANPPAGSLRWFMATAGPTPARISVA